MCAWERSTPGRALELADRYPVTHLCGAPVVLGELARAGAATGFVAKRSIRAAVGGAPPTKETIAAVQAMGVRVTHLYGLTETYGPSLVCEYQDGWAELPAAELAGYLSRQGVPTVSVADVRVADGQLAPVPADGKTVGEILVRSNTVTAGYLDDEATTAAAFQGGWFHTGDLGVLHPDGYIELTDRSKDVIISGGENIASVEVEKVLAAHPDVVEVAVVAAPHEHWGERPVAFVTTERPDLTAQELIDFVRERLAHFKAPDRVYFRGAAQDVDRKDPEARAPRDCPERGSAWPDDRYPRVNVAVQLTSHVCPPSVENACAHCGRGVSTSDQV